MPEVSVTVDEAEKDVTDSAASPQHVQTVSLAEPVPVSAQQWQDRKLRAEVAQRELIAACHRRRFPLDPHNLHYQALQMLLYALIAEERLTQDEASARIGEYQLIYLRSDYQNYERQASQGRPPLVEPVGDMAAKAQANALAAAKPKKKSEPGRKRQTQAQLAVPQYALRRITRKWDTDIPIKPALRGKIRFASAPADGVQDAEQAQEQEA